MNSFLFPILSVIASIGLYFFFVSPNLEVISELKVQDAAFQQTIEDLREIDGIIARLESTYSGITKDDLLKLERFLPSEIDKTQLVTDVSALLIDDGIEVGSISLVDIASNNSETDDTQLSKQGVDLKFFASYADFKKVLTSIENNLQIAKVSSINVSPPGSVKGQDNSQGLTQYELSLIFYSYNLESAN